MTFFIFFLFIERKKESKKARKKERIMKERKKEKRKKYNKRTIFSNLIFDRQTDRKVFV
jgi:hypothetical protein